MNLSINKLQDWHARDQGWTNEPYGRGRIWKPRNWPDTNVGIRSGDNHPIPATIDAADACFPEGWTWTRETLVLHLYWSAKHDMYHHTVHPHLKVEIDDTGNKVRDLLALARLCRIAQGATP